VFLFYGDGIINPWDLEDQGATHLKPMPHGLPFVAAGTAL